MAVRILVVEDATNTGSILTEHLSQHLQRVAHLPTQTVPDDFGNKNPHARLSGLLDHICPRSWRPFQAADFDVQLLTNGQLQHVITAASQGTDALIEAIAEICPKEFVVAADQPDVLVVDLALSGSEQRSLIDEGGNWEPDPERPLESMPDPRPELERMTGFHLLRAFGNELPVIATSYARNPLVAQHCLANGAWAIVRKPVVDKETDPDKPPPHYDMETANQHPGGIIGLEEAADDAKETLAVVVNHYLTAVAAEVLKALGMIGSKRVENHLPTPDFLRTIVFNAD